MPLLAPPSQTSPSSPASLLAFQTILLQPPGQLHRRAKAPGLPQSSQVLMLRILRILQRQGRRRRIHRMLEQRRELVLLDRRGQWKEGRSWRRVVQKGLQVRRCQVLELRS